jgi:hypothetical protein
LAQGALAPPGPPGPTFKTLSQVEPRFAVFTFQTNLIVPGSYYLTTNLFAGTNINDGITVRTNMNNITIDLNGFAIMNTNPASSTASPVGIRISGATNIVVRNGQIFGFDRGVRIEAPSSHIVMEDLHVSHCRRAGLEADGNTAYPVLSVTMRDCVIENIDATGKGASVTVDGIVLIDAIAVVQNCVVRDLVPVGGGTSTCINALTSTNTFVDGNFLPNAQVGLAVTGGGTRVYYRNNLTAGCATPFSSTGGVDRGGNF